MNSVHTRQTPAVATLAFTLAFSLSGCGGGGAASALPAPVPVRTTAALQGIWQSPVGASSTLSAIALSDGTLWAIISGAGVTRLVKASLSAQAAGFGGSGKSYTLGASTATSVTATATADVVEKTSLTGTLTASDAQPEAFALVYQSRYDTPAVLSDYAGAWGATLGPGVVNWTIDSAGALNGTRTTGCTYSGQLSVRTEQKAVLNATVTETCAGAVAQLGGVAVFNADKTRITMLLTAADETTGVALSLGH